MTKDFILRLLRTYKQISLVNEIRDENYPQIF